MTPYLESVLITLWPRPETPPFGVRPRHSRSLLLLPNRDDPRLVLPRRPWRVTGAALRNYNTAASGLALLKSRLAAALLRIGAGELLPHKLVLPLGQEEAIDEFLAARLERDLVVALYVGPPRAVQKPVLQLLTPGGETFAFAKLSVNERTAALVENEGRALRALGQAQLAHVQVPSILHRGEWNGRQLLVQEAVSRSGSARVSPWLLRAATKEVAHSCGSVHGALTASPFWVRLGERVSGLPPSPLASALRRTLEVLELNANDRSLTFGSWHGDWSPWNMTSCGATLMVWDWEGFETGVPLGFDGIHFVVNEAVAARGLAVMDAFAEAIRQAHAVLTPLGVEADSTRLTVLLYTLEVASRYLAEGEVDLAGTSLSRVEDWLEPVLDVQLDALQGTAA